MSTPLHHAINTQVTTEVKSFRVLGRWLSEQGSDDQAEFLLGLAHGFGESSPMKSGTQMFYVRDTLNEHDLYVLTEFFRRFLQYLEPIK